jgi:mannose-6-phosphate isomerase-like protein (cupin superfamily)
MPASAHLDDLPPFTTLDGSTIREIAGLAANGSAAAANQSLAEATVPVGRATTAHYHVLAEELYFFRAGTGTLRVGDDTLDVRPGLCVTIPPGAEHKLTNTGDEPLVLWCCCSPAYTHEDTILTEDPAEA